MKKYRFSTVSFATLAQAYLRERFLADEAKRMRCKTIFPPESDEWHKTFHVHSRRAAALKRRAYRLLREGAA